LYFHKVPPHILGFKRVKNKIYEKKKENSNPTVRTIFTYRQSGYDPQIGKNLTQVKQNYYTNNFISNIVMRTKKYDYEFRHFYQIWDKYTIKLLNRECSCEKCL
jgi:hypothetical protein